MGIRPIDMQVVVQKSVEIHSAKQSVINKQDTAMQQSQGETKTVVNEQQHTVTTTEEARHNAIKDDQEQKNHQQQKKQKNKKSENDKDVSDSPKDPFGKEGIHFDMKV
jgi:hypothetical protein